MAFASHEKAALAGNKVPLAVTAAVADCLWREGGSRGVFILQDDGGAGAGLCACGGARRANRDLRNGSRGRRGGA